MGSIRDARRFPSARVTARRLLDDRQGASSMVIGLALTGVIGLAGLGTEGGVWYFVKRNMQGAADAAAYSAVQAGTAYSNQAKAVASNFGFVDQVNGVTVTANQPPSSGRFTGNSQAVEVIIRRPQQRLFARLFVATDPSISARAVAVPGSGNDCVLALNKTASGAITGGGTTNVNLIKCGIADNSNNSNAFSLSGGGTISADNVSIVGGLAVSNNSTLTTTGTPAPVTGATAVPDPYANVQIPTYSGCDYNNLSPVHGNVSKDAGGGTKVICGGIQVNGGGTLTLQNGVFILDGGSINIAGGATFNVINATVILTSSSGTNFGTVTFNGGATISATAPITGATAGLAFFIDRNAPTGTDNFSGGSGQTITGAIYAPSHTINYTGGVTTGSGCTQIVGDQVAFSGNSAVESDCTGKGTKQIASLPQLVE